MDIHQTLRGTYIYAYTHIYACVYKNIFRGNIYEQYSCIYVFLGSNQDVWAILDNYIRIIPLVIIQS